MKKATTLILFLFLASLRGFAQPTAQTTTLPARLYTANEYVTIPNTAFSGSANNFTLLNLTRFPDSALNLRVTINGATTTYTRASFPQGGIWFNTNGAGNPTGTIEVKPRSANEPVQIYYVLWAPNGSGSISTSTACIYLPFYTVPLDVTLARFTGSSKGGATQLEWTTSSEKGLSGFDVEWSSNLSEWSTVGNIASRGAGSVYSWSHESPAQGANFYRVRSISLDGALTLSAVVRVDHSGRAASITATPNPTRDFLRIEAPAGSMASLVDLGGKEVSRLQLSSVSGTMNVQHLASGMYQLTVRSTAGSLLAQERIVKP